MKRVFLIHGWGSNPNAHWLPWLKKELEARGFEVVAPQMPNPDLPTRTEWVEALTRLIGTPDKDTYVAAHSLGCIATVRYLETLPVGTKFGGCVFVGGFSGNISIPELATFYEEAATIDFSKVKDICPRIVTIFSDNDEYVPLEKAQVFAHKIGARSLLVNGAGHFRSKDGFKELPVVLESIIKMSA